MGNSWEGFELEELIRFHEADVSECFFRGLLSGAELDLHILKDSREIGAEIKHTERPKLTPSMKRAMEVLQLDSLSLIYRGE